LPWRAFAGADFSLYDRPDPQLTGLFVLNLDATAAFDISQPGLEYLVSKYPSPAFSSKRDYVSG
jgi:hypothetical protein